MYNALSTSIDFTPYFSSSLYSSLSRVQNGDCWKINVKKKWHFFLYFTPVLLAGIWRWEIHRFDQTKLMSFPSEEHNFFILCSSNSYKKASTKKADVLLMPITGTGCITWSPVLACYSSYLKLVTPGRKWFPVGEWWPDNWWPQLWTSLSQILPLLKSQLLQAKGDHPKHYLLKFQHHWHFGNSEATKNSRRCPSKNRQREQFMNDKPQNEQGEGKRKDLQP